MVLRTQSYKEGAYYAQKLEKLKVIEEKVPRAGTGLELLLC